MKCRNIFCSDHDQETGGNCGYYQSEKEIEFCHIRKRYNRVAKAPVLAWKWDKEHDKYYGRK